MVAAWRRGIVPGCAGAVAALLLSAPALAGTLRGSATYRERIALPPDAEFEVLIEDIARADAPATVISRQVLAPAGQPPFRFAITYDERSVTPRGRYSLRATVRHQGRLLFTTDTIAPVRLDGGDPPVELLLRRVAGSGSGQRQIVAPLRGTTWRLLMLEGQQVGVSPPPGLPIELQLLVDKPRIAGSGGCNRLIGGFSLQGGTLRFSQLASSQMACGPEVMDLERVRRWSVDRRSLLLQDAAGRTLLLFQAADGPAQRPGTTDSPAPR